MDETDATGIPSTWRPVVPSYVDDSTAWEREREKERK